MTNSVRWNRAVLQLALEPVAQRLTDGLTDYARKALDGAGSGIQHAGQPNPSSRPGEYPARQEGDLQRSIGSRKVGPLRHEWGAIIDPPPEAVALQTKPESAGGRHWAEKLLTDPAAHDAALRRVRRL